eukprot:TRINITY_DN55375_c0_g1_i1.p1 TRINITY_DN55375_c0_g1~~TRINITY_DN55375_c0_g1_i1.p1  ORF type:complete len:431 (+),score=76.65 TRINITY_DN55375_c0_g1_i1:100-1392(+)
MANVTASSEAAAYRGRSRSRSPRCAAVADVATQLLDELQRALEARNGTAFEHVFRRLDPHRGSISESAIHERFGPALLADPDGTAQFLKLYMNGAINPVYGSGEASSASVLGQKSDTIGASPTTTAVEIACELTPANTEVAPTVVTQEQENDEEVLPFGCFGCELRFADQQRVRDHMLKSSPCSGEFWQAAVRGMACLPGAGTTLWCPACPQTFVGCWAGSATRAAAMLRHVGAAAAPGATHAGAHARFLEAIVEVLIRSDPPPPSLATAAPTADDNSEALQDWARTSGLLDLAGPLLAPRSAATNRAVRVWQESVLGPDPIGDDFSSEEGEEDPAPEGASRGETTKKKKKKRKMMQVASSAVLPPNYDLYNNQIPLDVFAACNDEQARTADGVPIIALSDSEEEQALPSARATEQLEAKAHPVKKFTFC